MPSVAVLDVVRIWMQVYIVSTSIVSLPLSLSLYDC